ncbi:MAG: Arc family DNA-binding protein [Bacteroidaceae bacterium]|nr:Arc family DNA-binding protein [Bacteroidaceae bacterium]
MAKDKKSFVLRMSSETMATIEKWAADEFRSVNGQIEYLITDALRKAGRLKKSENDGE